MRAGDGLSTLARGPGHRGEVPDALAFVWELFGSLLGAPRWLLDATPFQHIGLVPAQPFRLAAAASMLAIAAATSVVAVQLFGRRDLISA